MQEQKILFYNGTYVKERKCGKDYDYLTYEENPKRNYNIYLDLDSSDVYKVNIEDLEQFEQENIIIRIPVVVNSFHEYIYNHMKVQKWYNNEKKLKSIEEIRQEIKEKQNYKTKKLSKVGYNYSQK